MRTPLVTLRFIVTSTACIVILVPACAKKPGAPCKGNDTSCESKRSAIICRRGVYVSVPCDGPNACTKQGESASCDTSVATEGVPCMGEDDEYACTLDKKRSFVCKGGKFEPHLECRGKGGCTLLGRTVSCDQSLVAKGDICKTQGAVSCSEDQKQMLVCQSGKFQIYRYCRGQYGCYQKGETPSCDETLSMPNDPCGIPGQVVCAVDGKSELVCQGGVFMTSLTCKTACVVTNRPGRPIDCQ